MKNLFKLLIIVIIGVIYFSNILSPVKAFDNNYYNSVRASHILVDTKTQAQDIKTQIDNGASFESMAKKYSKCPSKDQGGDLGYFERGQMVPEFEDAAFNLPIGKVSEPVKTQFGWHIIKVTDKR